MAYFTGKNLDRKIAEFGLEDLDQMFLQYRKDGLWGRSQILSLSNPDWLESLRIVVYSLLHRHGLKNDFAVKFIGETAVSISHKGSTMASPGKRVQTVQYMDESDRFGSPGHGPNKSVYQNPDQLPPLGDEGLASLFADPPQPLPEKGEEK